MARVSVIIPTYNRAGFLSFAIGSVLGQTFQDFEIIIVDDASTDNTEEVVGRFCDQRIRYYCRDLKGNTSTGRNRGIREAQSSYIAFLDDDDEWLPEKLEKQIALLDQSPPSVGGIYTGYIRILRSNGESLGITLPTKKGDLSSTLLSSNVLAGASGLLLRKECLLDVGLFDEDLPSFQDYDLWIRISKKFTFDYVDEVLYRYHIHDNKIWNDPMVLSRGLDKMIHKHCTRDLAVRKNFSAQILLVGVMFCYQGHFEKGRKFYLKAIRLYPWEIRNYFNLFLSFLGAKNFKKIKALKEKYSL